MRITRSYPALATTLLAFLLIAGAPAIGGDVSSAKVFYFGHSLVGHDLPQMLGALARARGKAGSVNGQVGFGTSLQSHWRWQGEFDRGFVPSGFGQELPGAVLFGPHGHQALASGAYDVVVLTETNGFVSGSPGKWNDFCAQGEEFGGCSIPMALHLVRKARQNNPSVPPRCEARGLSAAGSLGRDAKLHAHRHHRAKSVILNHLRQAPGAIRVTRLNKRRKAQRAGRRPRKCWPTRSAAARCRSRSRRRVCCRGSIGMAVTTTDGGFAFARARDGHCLPPRCVADS